MIFARHFVGELNNNIALVALFNWARMSENRYKKDTCFSFKDTVVNQVLLT